jgi:NAD(P)-dependent dehydrogenase (short-subunit alcohol dehydrogenase family)
MTDRQMLVGRQALVTGASRGLGRAIAIALAREGARTIAVARASDDLQSLAAELQPDGEVWEADVTTDALLSRIEALEGVDILINNAGTNVPQAFLDVDVGTLDRILDLNVRTTFRISQAAARRMAKGSTIINITSQMGHVGSPRRSVYCMSKHAIEGLTKALAVELAPAGIRVNSVAPTFVETPMTAPMLADPEFRAFVQRMIPLGRTASPEDVAAAVIYLASPAAGMITGHSLLVDGGWTAQ